MMLWADIFILAFGLLLCALGFWAMREAKVIRREVAERFLKETMDRQTEATTRFDEMHERVDRRLRQGARFRGKDVSTHE